MKTFDLENSKRAVYSNVKGTFHVIILQTL